MDSSFVFYYSFRFINLVGFRVELECISACSMRTISSGISHRQWRTAWFQVGQQVWTCTWVRRWNDRQDWEMGRCIHVLRVNFGWKNTCFYLEHVPPMRYLRRQSQPRNTRVNRTIYKLILTMRTTKPLTSIKMASLSYREAWWLPKTCAGAMTESQ